MPEYRIYMLTADNKIAGPAVEVDCQSDEEVVAHAAYRGQHLHVKFDRLNFEASLRERCTD